MKLLRIIFISLILIICYAGIGVCKETRELIIPEISAGLTGNIIVPIQIDDATGISGADIWILYDENILTASDADITELSSDMDLVANTDISGKIIVSMAGEEAITGGSGSLVDITFSINAGATVGTKTALVFNEARIYDNDGQKISTTTQDGKAIIGVRGDVDGDGEVRSDDAILALRIAAMVMRASAYEKWAADMNNDGEVWANDAILIQREAVGLLAPAANILAHIGRQITISLGEVHGTVGQTVAVSLMVDDIHSLSGGDICISYDPTVLSATGVSSDSGTLMIGNVHECGIVRISFMGAGSLSSETLANIQFDVIAGGTSTLEFQRAKLYRLDASPVNSRPIDSQFRLYVMPKRRNMLLQNFPNPFNPETWIPFQLRDQSFVTIRIHSTTGQLVRTLELGYREAGVYASRSEAAYWDGKNEAGEQVASGIYLCSISATNFSATRKMIVQK